MEHTPGPWTINEEEGLVESPYGHVALVSGWDNPDDETAPNARLIAAAPELLDWLRYAQDFIQAAANGETWPDSAVLTLRDLAETGDKLLTRVGA